MEAENLNKPTDTNYLPTIIIAKNEQLKLSFKNCPSELGTLSTGDYSVKDFENDFTVETKKDLGDLIGSLTHDRARFERELVRMRGYEFRRIVIIGSLADVEAGNYRSKTEPKSVIASLTAFEVRYSVPVMFCATYEEAAIQVERWAYYFLRGKIKSAQQIVKRYMEPKK